MRGEVARVRNLDGHLKKSGLFGVHLLVKEGQLRRLEEERWERIVLSERERGLLRE